MLYWVEQVSTCTYGWVCMSRGHLLGDRWQGQDFTQHVHSSSSLPPTNLCSNEQQTARDGRHSPSIHHSLHHSAQTTERTGSSFDPHRQIVLLCLQKTGWTADRRPSPTQRAKINCKFPLLLHSFSFFISQNDIHCDCSG